MKNLLLAVFLTISTSASASPMFKIDQLQGAWWSDLKNPTADFAIQGNEVWLDYDSQYHPCKIENDILIFNLGEGIGNVKKKIISIKGDALVLEALDSKKRTKYIRVGLQRSS